MVGVHRTSSPHLRQPVRLDWSPNIVRVVVIPSQTSCVHTVRQAPEDRPSIYGVLNRLLYACEKLCLLHHPRKTMNAPWSSLQPLNSFLATVTNGRTATSTANAVASTTTSTSSVETIESVSLGQTVTLTVTHDPVQSSQPTSSTALTADRTDGSSTPVGAIAGGTVGGVLLVASAIFLFFFIRRRRRIKEQRRATLPPPYPGTDMSEQLAGQSSAIFSWRKLMSHRYHDHGSFR
jgi:hypothetical protein